MATSDQIKALIRSHLDDDPERFVTVALQLAAHEAQKGHAELARDIRGLVDKAKSARKKANILAFPSELDGCIDSSIPGIGLSALVLPDKTMDRLRRVIREYRQRDHLSAHGLKHRRKLLLVGPPGCGKTMTARVLAHELRLGLNSVQVDRLVTKFMGETSSRLRLLFEIIHNQEGVYLFDEFDSIGAGRGRDYDVGEMRRVITALMQFIENDDSDSLIVAATNSPELLDKALFRRFDDVLVYSYPEPDHRRRLVINTLGSWLPKKFGWVSVLKKSNGLSSADIVHSCKDLLKEAVLSNKSTISGARLCQIFEDRQYEHRR